MLEVKTVTTDEVVRELLNLAAEMYRGELLPSSDVDDWNLPAKVGKKTKRVIQTEAWRMHSQAHVWGRRLKNIADAIRKTEREKAKEQIASGCGGNPCCHKHYNYDAFLTPVSRPFITCRTCGNKRCPKASDCSLECTNSNEPGQEGSVY